MDKDKIREQIPREPGEKWEPFPMNEAYWVSTKGRVWHSRNGRMLAYPNTDYSMWKEINGVRKHRVWQTAELVALTWLQKPAGRWRVRVKNMEQPLTVENVEWVVAPKRVRGPMAQETKEKIGERLRMHHPKRKGIYVIDGEEYPTLQAAAEAKGLWPNQVLRKIRKGEPGWGYRPSAGLPESVIEQAVARSARVRVLEQLKEVEEAIQVEEEVVQPAEDAQEAPVEGAESELPEAESDEQEQERGNIMDWL